MTRRTFARKSLIAALALMMAAAPSIALAGSPTPKHSPIQFKNWGDETLYNVTITHNYGLNCRSQTFRIGDVAPGQTVIGGWVTYYTTGSNSGDFWTITATLKDYDDYTVYRSLDRYDLYDVDRAVPLTLIISNGGPNTGLGCAQQLSYYSNNGAELNLPMAFHN